MSTKKYKKLIQALISITTSSLISANIYAVTSHAEPGRQSVNYNQQQLLNHISVSNLTPSLDGAELFAIAGKHGNGDSLYVYVIDTATGKTTKKIKLPNTNNPNTYGPFNMILSPDGRMLYLVASTEIIKIDAINKQILSVISSGKKSSDRSIDISGDGSKVIAADFADYGGRNETYIHIIDTLSNKLSEIQKGSASGGFYRSGFANLVVDKLSNKVYLLDHEHDDSIAILDLNSKQLELNAIQLNSRASIWSMAFDSSRGILYMIEPDKCVLDLIDVNSKKMIDQLKFNNGTPESVTLTPDGNLAYVQFNSSSEVSVLNTKTRQVIKSINVSGDELRISSDGKKIYSITQSHIFGDTWSSVYIQEADTGKILNSFPVEYID